MKATRNLLMTLTAMAAVGLAAGTAPANLVAHYPLDTIAGGTTPDSTGGTAGTLNGTGITQAGTGVIGDSFDFSGGTAQYVGIPNHPWGTTAFTTSVWFNPDSLGNQGPVADWTNGGASPQTFLVRTSGSTLQTYVRSGGTQVGGNVSFPSETLTTSDFNHVVLTYDGQRARTYLNGELSTTVHNFGSAKTIGNGSTADIAAIGGRGSSEQDLAGLVDDVAFWNVTLTDGKAAALTNLAKQAALNYDAAQADQLFEVFDGAASDVTIGSKTWSQATGHGGSAGDVVDLGGGDFFLNLDGTAGVSTLTGSPPPTEFKIDVNTGGSPTMAGWTGLDATYGSNGGTVTVDGVEFWVDSADGARNRGGPNDLTRDFIYDDGSGQATGLRINDLPDGIWEAKVWSWDNDFPTSVGSQTVGIGWAGPAGFEAGTMNPSATVPFTFQFDSSALPDGWGIFTRENNSANRSRFNALQLTRVIPEPMTMLAVGLSVAGLGGYVRKRPRGTSLSGQRRN